MRVDLIETVEQLESLLSTPTEELVDFARRSVGDLLVLGAGGKMGPTLAMRAKAAFAAAGNDARVIAVSRFSDQEARRRLEHSGVETIACDLLAREELDALPSAPNVIFMAGRKFGSVGNEPLTWVMNTFLPGEIMQRFASSRIVALSTGNVYGFSPVTSRGSRESDSPAPIGEYAQSCLGRERIMQHFCELHRTPLAIVRLNYAIDLRYGVLLDIAQKVFHRLTIDLTMSRVNVIWQGDANDIILRSLELCTTPATVLNVTGTEHHAVRWIAREFGSRIGIAPRFVGEEASDALLSDAARMSDVFGEPPMSLESMIDHVAHWVSIGGMTYRKPTHFGERGGAY